MTPAAAKALALLASGPKTATEIGLEVWGYEKKARQRRGEGIVMTDGNPARYARPGGRLLHQLRREGLAFFGIDDFRKRVVWTITLKGKEQHANH